MERRAPSQNWGFARGRRQNVQVTPDFRLSGTTISAALPTRRAVTFHACPYQSIKSVLECHLDSQAIEPAADPKPLADHPNIRGLEYLDTGKEPTDRGK